MKTDGYSRYVCDKCGKTAYVAAGDTEARDGYAMPKQFRTEMRPNAKHSAKLPAIPLARRPASRMM